MAKRDIPDKTRWSESPWLLLKGFLMGSADIIPGVSGGTMALITGIYDRLVNAVRSLDSRVLISLVRLQWSRATSLFHWKFLVILIGGIITAVFFFTRIVPLQLYMHSHPEALYGLFFGLIFGSAILLLLEVDPARRTAGLFPPLLAGIFVGFWIVTMVPTDADNTGFYIFFSGMVAFSAMILPGISGSYILVILGNYDFVLARLGELGGDATLTAGLALLPFFLGGAVGLALFSRLLSWLLFRYHTLTLVLLTGFLFGSLYAIWPFQEREYDINVTRIEQIAKDDPRAIELRENPPSLLQPSYIRLGRELSVEGEKYVELEWVERSLSRSTPYLPGDDEHPISEVPLAQGVGGILIGLVLVAALDALRRKQ